MTIKRNNNILWFVGVDQKYISESIKSEHYIEAIQLLHSELEALLGCLFMLSFKVKENEDDKRQTIQCVNELNYRTLSNVLFIANLISKKQFNSLILCNKLRNRIIHSLFEESYNGKKITVYKSECKRVAKIGLELMEEIVDIIESI